MSTWHTPVAWTVSSTIVMLMVAFGREALPAAVLLFAVNTVVVGCGIRALWRKR